MLQTDHVGGLYIMWEKSGKEEEQDKIDDIDNIPIYWLSVW
jgi:hypothetical protein